MPQSFDTPSSGHSAASRLSVRNSAPGRPDGRWVLYWMTAARRTQSNFALQRAVAVARRLERPLLVLEAIRCGHPHASVRFHRFVLDGMAVQRDRFAAAGVGYHPYVEPAPGAGKGLLERLAADACVVIADDAPISFLARMTEAAAARVPVRFEAVDSWGVLPLDATDRTFPSAYVFRRFLQESLRPHLAEMPLADPLADLRGPGALPPCPPLPDDVLARWPRATDTLLDATGRGGGLASLPIDQAVAPVALRGGSIAGMNLADGFVDAGLRRYDSERNDPDASASSGLSPYLHFGHVSPHDVLARIMQNERWSLAATAAKATGQRGGWWGMSPPAEAFLDQIVTWRELGANFSRRRPADEANFESLPEWAKATLGAHRGDTRTHLYSLDEFEAAATHDEIWNAAQRQLRAEGRIHNYLRMLWGKKVLEWSATPEDAARVLVHLNDKYALDGRDPNSYSGIFWCFGRYDRPWGPERPVYGTIRYMSCDAARRKLRMDSYLARWSEGASS